MRFVSRGLLFFVLCVALISCSKKTEQRQAPGAEMTPAESTVVDTSTDTSAAEPVTAPPVAMTQFVLDPQSRTIFKLNLTNDSIAARYPAEKNLKCIAFDYMGRKLYKGYHTSTGALEVWDTENEKTIKRVEFPQPVSAMLFHPLKRHLYIVSEDSTNFIDFNCDSLGVRLSLPLHVTDKGFVGPITLEPGPQGKLITANGKRAGVTQIFPEHHYMYQTITINDANYINNAVFSRDGNASYSCDTKKGSIYKIQFGTGEPKAQKDSLDNPRLIQIEVTSNTVIVVVDDNELLMLNPDTFVEIGHVSLADYGDKVLSFEIPPKANFAELLMDYKGVTRWLRFDVRTWQNTRLIELI